MSEKLVLIDGHSILNRAFFGIPDLTNSEGLHTNAVYGFLNIMFKILEEEQPDYLTVAFDVSEPTFRHKMFAEYKGTRKPMAAELKQQVPLMKEMLRAMGVTIIEKGGYEADDLLGTIAKRSEAAGVEVAVVSGDRDLLQLATDHIKIRIPKTKRTGTEIEDYNAKEVLEKYQVTPTEFIDVKALMGDTSDNIPGVPGIGEKTATAIIAKYGSIENAYAHVDELKPPRASTNLKEHYDMAQMSKTLATIDIDADIAYKLADAHLEQVSDLYTEEAYLLCKRLEFKNLLGRFSVEAPKNTAEEHFKKIEKAQEAEAFFASLRGKACGFYVVPQEETHDAHTEADGQMNLFGSFAMQNSGEEAGEQETAGSCHIPDFLGLAVACGEEEICYVEVSEALPCRKIRELFAGSAAASYATLDLKPQLKELGMLEKKCLGTISEENLFDNTIAAYLLNPIKNEYPYEDIAKDYAGLMIPSRKDLIEKLTYEKAAEKKPEEFLKCICYMAYVAYKTREPLEKELADTGMDALFREIEMPLVFTLADMEKEGIIASGEALKEYGDRLAVRIDELERKIYEEAGEEFNINSPKQLGVILFEKLSLPNGKKTKTGYSTAADVLDRLAPDYPIVADILEYRQLTKLKSTYADGLVNYIAEDGRIHTSFNQTITATGRLSSSDPNLQNIPTRSELGRTAKTAFSAGEGSVFLAVDYSQIELRLLAHLSGDEHLVRAFNEGEDFHAETAARVFGVPVSEVTPDLRSRAKAVNFGIVYGQQAYGLSQSLHISMSEARDMIDRYYEAYPGVRTFLDNVVARAKQTGYAETMYGRRRHIPELKAKNPQLRGFGERTAMNHPMQGTAADIIKIAMARVSRRLEEEGFAAHMILQVHDELDFECPIDEVERLTAMVQDVMEHVVDLRVPLIAEASTGITWADAK